MSSHQSLASLATATKYNFINKVIDGMTIGVNMVSIKFTSPAFTASVQVSHSACGRISFTVDLYFYWQ